MTTRDVDDDYALDDPHARWFGWALPVASVVPSAPTEPASSTAHYELGTAGHVGDGDAAASPNWADDPDTDRWYAADLDRALAPAAEPSIPIDFPMPKFHAENAGSSEPRVSEPRVSEPRLSSREGWDTIRGASSSQHWYRSHRLLTSLVAAVAVIVGVVVVVALLLDGQAPSTEDTSVTPGNPSPTPPSTPAATSVPSASREAPPPPAPPPPPPPPPPTVADVGPPLANRQYRPSYRTPDPPKKPQINVTRSPMSATPPPPPSADRNSGTPGDSPPRRRGCFGFC
ncbi:hypothetical protein BH09ACT8_BH09ACT8_55400 [soil metagenome]